jgi:subtilisin family serine protease
VVKSILLAVLLAGIPAAAQSENYNGHAVVGRQILMRLKTAPNSTTQQQLRQVGDADDLRTLNNALNLLVLHSRSANVPALIALMRNLPFVSYVEPDFILTKSNTPNDPNFPLQWPLLNTATPGADISATTAWNISTGSTSNVVGVVDTGLDYTHPDLASNVWSSPGPFTVSLSWGQLTCAAGSHGYNSIARSCNPLDDNGHGTHTSGTIGAVGNNATGVAGVNWVTRIMGLKFLDSTGSGSTSDAIDAIEFAIQVKTQFAGGSTPVNVRALSNSYGGGGFSQAFLDEINKANTNDILFVAAAGNNATNNDTTPTYPASYNAPNVIAVAATTSTDTLASFSNYGHASVHLGAPGVSVLSTLPGSSYGYLSGTSMATPHVTGAAMLILSACSINTAGVKSAILSNVDPLASLNGITVTGGRLNVNKAIRSCASTTTGSAAFVRTDTTTQGSWKGVYGGDGYNVINDTVNYPSYVTVTPSGNNSAIWMSSTSDVRALQKAASSTDRLAACWWTNSSYTVSLNFSDTNTHQVALYLLDWDYNGRTERVDILDSQGNSLDSRTISGFSGGQYWVWNMSGHVTIRLTNIYPTNAVMSGIFFGAGAGPPVSTATFVKTDTTTQGSWKGVYGGDGYNVINDTVNYPSYVTVTPAGTNSAIWTSSTSDVRALQKAASSTDRLAACWWTNSSYTIDLNFSDTNTHQIALYLLDWDYNGRTERVDILDTRSNTLDTRTVSGFMSGQYWVWNVSGHVIVRLMNYGPTNAVMSGIFFGAGSTPPPSSAALVRTDTTTQGSWKGVYGADGYNVINDTVNYPSYVTVTPSGNNSAIWIGSTSDGRALQKAASSTDRLAACWWTNTTDTIDLNFSDTNTHQVALYLLDWDYNYRTERVDIYDAQNNLLDTRTVSTFMNGQYWVWNMSGHVIIRLTNVNSSNAVVSGIFFR